MTGEDSEPTETYATVLRDLESKYRDVACPVHGEPPAFEVGEKGAILERFCCEALLQIVRELQATEESGEAPPPVDPT